MSKTSQIKLGQFKGQYRYFTRHAMPASVLLMMVVIIVIEVIVWRTMIVTTTAVASNTFVTIKTHLL